MSETHEASDINESSEVTEPATDTTDVSAANTEGTAPHQDTNPPQDTGTNSENQLKVTPNQTELEFQARLLKRFKDVNNILTEKEALQLEFVYKRASKSYYKRWKTEGNDTLVQLIQLKRRMTKSDKAS